ncbi:HNH endonuclease [Pseudoalteromonas sp. S16_S37]|uniref:HNH endonuclease n=1 Tax=Pseudoalteromonas sp. S16_S37 TaxID=2720228 RepID=UPI00168142AB|nr:HNH endonuclease [Pseudoalteromonas sp. S16_S37]MBD1583488.1 HNH endonuclease [Pseudoalteromonas sp. S16_S37]
MPQAIPKRCRERGCGNRTTHRHGYCDQHADKASWGNYQQQQQRKGKRIYQTKEWRTEIAPRVKELANHLCLNCLLGTSSLVVPGNVCEHIIPVSMGGDESDKNLSCFCNSCAKDKTAWERGKSKDLILKKYANTSIFNAIHRGMGVKLLG